ncbi:MAG: MMPL family transporter [Bacteroidetes bacterium]|nr:MMPL family transporter [Bacteroidota bacterium]
MMHRVFHSLRPLIRGVVNRAGWVLLLALALSAVSLRQATGLRIDTDLANLIPPEYPSVQALDRLRETVGGESEAAVAIESPSFEANRAFAEALIPRILALRTEDDTEEVFQRVDYRKETDFLKRNALYFATPSELDMLEGWLEDKIVDARLEANPMFFDLEDDEAEPDSIGEELADIYNEIVSKEYPISDDSLTMVLRFFPAEASSDVAFIENAYAGIDQAIAETDPTSFHPQMQVTTAGRLYRQMTEITTIQKDVLDSFGSGVMAVLLFVVLYFFYKSYVARAGRTFRAGIFFSELARTPILALVIGLPLLMSLAWTFGLADVVYGELNLMTSTLGLVLFGLGIDYGIHFYARYSEERAEGHSVVDAAETTFSSTGQAITIGALTTSLALFVLVIADFRGFSQFGFIAGFGILFALVAMLLVMPALLAIFERFRMLNLEAHEAAETVRASGKPFPAARPVLLASVGLVIAAVVFLPRVEFEYRFGELEPTYVEYEARRDVVRKVFNDRRRRNPAYVVVDDPAEIPAITAALQLKIDADTLSPTINRVESLQDRFPMTEPEQNERLTRLAGIRELLDDAFLREDDSEDMERLRTAASTDRVLALEEVPEFLRKQFTSKTGEMGNFVIIYPLQGLSDGRQSMAFSDDVGEIITADGRVYHAGSTSLVAADMLKLMQSEAPWMVLATLFLVALLMFVNFTTPRWTLLALVPLAVGVLWMLFLVEIFHARLNFYNLIVLPAVLGIGNDAGVHLVHRYMEMGRGSIRAVLRSTGEHVAMGSLTTMIGFGGLLLSFHPGLQSIGQLAVMGIGATLAAALFFLPALLQWLENRVSRASEGS